MKKQLRTALLVSLGLLSAGTAMANDAVIGALLGGGAGVLVGRSVGGRNGAVIGGALGAAAGAAIGSENRRDRVVEQRVDYYQPAPVYYEQPAYYPPQQVYYTQPVRVEQRPVYIVRGERDWDGRGHRRQHDWNRHDRDWDYRR